MLFLSESETFRVKIGKLLGGKNKLVISTQLLKKAAYTY
jgi:hypothetical protein